MGQPLLEARGLTVAVDGRTLFSGLSLTLGKGEALLVTGPSGSGKTSLLRVLAGVPGGGLRVSGSISRRARVLYVPQEPWFSLTAPFVAQELLFYTGGVEWARLLGVSSILESSTLEISAGEAQRVALATALGSGAQIVLVDEATSYLEPSSRGRIVEAVRLFVESGGSAIVVDHDPLLWRGLVSRVLYISGGRALFYDDPADTPQAEALRRLRALFRRRHREGGGECLVVEDLWYRYPDSALYVLRGLSFSGTCGSVVWVRGGSGRGKTTLLRLLAGLLAPVRGRVVRRGRVLYVPENPLLFLSEPTVGDELRGCRSVLEAFGLVGLGGVPVGRLSSGERRRLALASALCRGARILLVDEPTIGLDPWAALRVLEALDEAASRGVLVVTASHGEEMGLVADTIIDLGGAGYGSS